MPEATTIAKVVFNYAWCKRCDICAAFCARRAIALDDRLYPYLIDADRCNSCGLCEVLCPDFAVTVPTDG